MTWKRMGPQIVGQAMDSEVIVADLQTGFYHSITGSGTVMWNGIDRGYTREQILQLLQSAYQSTPERLSQALTEFVDTLVDHDLIKPGETTASEPLREANVVDKKAFTPALVVRFSGTAAALVEKSKLIRWQPSMPAVFERANDEVTVVDAQQGISCKITGSGALIWDAIDSRKQREQIIELVTCQYDVTPETAASAIDDFVAGLATIGLIQPANEPSNDEQMPVPKRTAPGAGHSHQKLTFAPPVMAVDKNRDDALRRITQRHGWQPATPRIVAETIDDEVLAVDLHAGIYHSITGAGIRIWEGIELGYSSEQILQSLLAHYDTTVDVASQEVDDFIGKLVEFALIRPRRSKSDGARFVQQAPPAVKERFQRSAMVVYRDMEDVLRLDPIHDFDEYGWPNQV